MELIDRYLQMVKQFLSGPQSQDILQELSDNLRSRMEDREAELGRPLNEEEQALILKEHGHPAVVAGRYRQDQRCLAFGRVLIGPALFPFYAKVLSFNLGITAFVVLVISIALGKSVAESISATLFHVLLQFGIVTPIFIAVEKYLARVSAQWDPRDPWAAPPVAKDERRVSRFESLAQLVALGVFLLWILAMRRAPDLVSDSSPDAVRFGPVWGQIYLPFVLLTLAGIAQACVNLVRPDWKWLRSAVHVGGSLVWLGLLCFLMLAGHWVMFANQAAPHGADSLRKLENVNQWVFYNLLVTAVISAAILLFDIRRLIRGGTGRRSTFGTMARVVS